MTATLLDRIRLTVSDQAVQDCCHGGEWIFVVSDGCQSALHLFANFAHRQRPFRAHENEAAFFGEARTPPGILVPQ